MAGFPRSDLDANNWQTVTPDDWSLIDHLKAYSSDARTALGNLGSNLLEGISPFHPDAAKAGAPSLQVPPMLQGIADSYSRLAGTPSKPGNAYDLTGVPELDAPIQGDMSNVLLSLYGGNAVSGFTKPKGALGAGAMREAGPTGNALASHRLEDSQMPMQPQAVQMGDDLAGRMPDLSQGQLAQAPRSLIENDPYLKAWSDRLGLNYDGLLSPAIARAASDGVYDYLGIRSTDGPLKIGDHAPNSYQWDRDVPTNEMLAGPSAVGLRLTKDGISEARRHVGQYWGDDVSLLGGHKREYGQDAGEWIMPGSVVLDSVNLPYRQKAKSPQTLFSDTGKPSLLGSALATAGEQPRTVKAYHSTPAQFDKFDNAFTDELGFHFGSKNQAHNRAYVQSGGNPLEYFFKWRDIPVEMDIKKAAQISGDVGKFDGPRMAQQLVRDGIAPYDLIASVMDAPKASQNGIVRDWLVNNGYDAVKYPNTFEGVGDPSYMALGTGNVRHAKTGQVLYSDGVPVPQNQQSDYDLAELLSRYGVSY